MNQILCFDANISFVTNGIVSHGDSWQDVYFDDESAEVVISSLRLGDDQERLVEALIFNLLFLFNTS